MQEKKIDSDAHKSNQRKWMLFLSLPRSLSIVRLPGLPFPCGCLSLCISDVMTYYCLQNWIIHQSKNGLPLRKCKLAAFTAAQFAWSASLQPILIHSNWVPFEIRHEKSIFGSSPSLFHVHFCLPWYNISPYVARSNEKNAFMSHNLH